VTGMNVLGRRERLSVATRLGLCAEILLAYGRARRALRTRTFPAVAAEMRRWANPSCSAGDDAYATGMRLGAAVARVLGWLSRDSRCLTTSLVLTVLLAKRGIPTTLVIGVRSDPFAAHAWVEHRGLPLLPAAAAPFERLLEV
jgi:Transglutaminase-like superfamily